jgi:hypothetical protein
MSNLSEWWGSLSLILKVYWSIAIPFTVFFLLQLVSTFFGGDDAPDDMPDSHSDVPDAGGGIQLFNLKTIVAFLTIFGWSGIASVDAGISPLLSFAIAGVSGFVVMLGIAFLMYALHKANADGTMKFAKAVGETGQVYLTIPAKRSNVGQVQLKVQGVLRTLDAITDDDTDLKTGRTIVVRQVLNDNTLLVSAK